MLNDNKRNDLIQQEMSFNNAPPVQSEEAHEGECLTRAWSVQTVIALLCLFCILATAVSTEVMGTIACDSGLDDTRSTMDASTKKMDGTAQESLTRVASDLMTYISTGVTTTLDNYLLAAMLDTERIIGIVQRELANVTKDNDEFLDTISARLWHYCVTNKAGAPSMAFGIAAGDRAVAMVKSSDLILDMPGFTEVEALTFYMKPNMTVFASAEPITGTPVLNGSLSYLPLGQKVEDLDFVKLARSGLLQETENVFPIVSPISNFVGYAITSRQNDPTGSVDQVETALFMSVTRAGDFLRSLTEYAGLSNSSAVMRAYTIVASTWLAQRKRTLGIPVLKTDEQAGLLTGVSHGEGDEPYIGRDPLFGVEGKTLYRPLPAVEAPDPVIRAVAIAVGDGYARLARTPEVLRVMLNGSIPENHIVSCDRLTYPQHGLDWWITVSIDAESVLGDVQRESAAVGMEIEEDKQRVADDIASQKVISRFIIAGIAVGLVVLSAVTSFIILRPIKALQQKMELVAGMQLDNMETESTSTFYELRHMQRDFRKMVHNLLEFRAYVPSSVLESNGYSGEGGRQVVEPPTGKVAIVFTDIKGSTNLWKLSPGDMNVAMEVHNEVMREACQATNGYEVKTIGDAFMVSFSCPVEAARFALDVQTNMAAQNWPAGLCLPVAGLVVRIGVNYGPTIAEENPVTGRVDYRGGTVNLASRVEGKARPGTVCITSDMCAAIRSDMDKLGDPVLASHGVHDIKGLGGGHELFTLVSQQQRNRLIDAETDTEMTRAPQSPLAGSMSDTKSIGSGRLRSESNASSKRVDNVPTKRTALQLQRTNATVAVCRLVHDGRDSVLFDNCNIMVRAAVEAAHATDGVISNVTGCSLSVLWNASKRSLMHTTAALSFASEMKKLEQIMQVGLATGTVLHGNVGTRTSRFATTFGVPLDAAEAMTEHAQRLGVYCLQADCSHDKRLQADVTVRSCLRLVDAWLDERRERPIQIYEVHMDLLDRAVQEWSLVGPSEGEDTSLEKHTQMVQSALQGSIEELSAFVAANPRDTVMLKVLELIVAARPTQGHRCAVRFSHVVEIPPESTIVCVM